MPGLGSDQQTWNTNYLHNWVYRRQTIPEYKLIISVPGLGDDQQSWNTSYLGNYLGVAATKNPGIQGNYLSAWAWQGHQSWDTSYLSN